MKTSSAPGGAWAAASLGGRSRSHSLLILAAVLTCVGAVGCSDDDAEPAADVTTGDVADATGDSGDTGVGDVSSDGADASGPAPGELGGLCASDDDCPNGSWCSDVAGYERCAPRALAGLALPMDFVYVPAGTFTQSSGEQSFESTLTRPYFVARYEVTDEQWTDLIPDLPTPHAPSCGNTCPVEGVTYWEAYEYANRLSVAELGEGSTCYELTSCSGTPGASGFTCSSASFDPDCTGYRLPTESEWERAARAETDTLYYWGDGATLADIDDHAWYEENSEERARPVGQKTQNAFGLYDIAGNASEWCWDTWTEDYPSGPQTDYIYRGSGAFLSFRGGNYSDAAVRLESGIRGGVPSGRFLGMGLRLVRNVPGT